jgi:hypothetical protein
MHGSRTHTDTSGLGAFSAAEQRSVSLKQSLSSDFDLSATPVSPLL